jgi:hypothetical protein
LRWENSGNFVARNRNLVGLPRSVCHDLLVFARRRTILEGALRGQSEQILSEVLAVNSSMQTWIRVALVALLAVAPTLAPAAERSKSKSAQPVGETVEMFAAMKAGDLEVSMIPKDSSEARITIKNNTDKPLNVKLPDAFAGMPVLAQARGAAGGAAGRPGGQQQPMGGGMGGMGMGGGGMGMGGGGMGMGMMNIPAEKVAQFKIAMVCLEHGKKEPRSSTRYEVKPIEEFTTKPEVKELLTAFGKRRLNQRATQAAAWHLANGMSWEELLNKQIEHLNGTSEPWFDPREIQSAMEIAQYSVIQAQQNAMAKTQKSSTLSQSSSNEKESSGSDAVSNASDRVSSAGEKE